MQLGNGDLCSAVAVFCIKWKKRGTSIFKASTQKMETVCSSETLVSIPTSPHGVTTQKRNMNNGVS
jgi:hypothetical protein